MLPSAQGKWKGKGGTHISARIETPSLHPSPKFCPAWLTQGVGSGVEVPFGAAGQGKQPLNPKFRVEVPL